MFTLRNPSAIVLQWEVGKKDDAQGTFCLFLGGKAAWQAHSGTLVSDCWLACNIPDYMSFCPSSGRQANRI